MALKAKRRTKSIIETTTPPHLNGHKNGNNGFHKREWQVGDPPELHPLAHLMGSHKDDPDWDEYIQLMKDLRREELARDLEALKDQP